MFSGSEPAPDTMGPVLLLPLLFTVFAVAARISARAYWRNFGKRKAHWWYVYPLLGLALVFGAAWMYKIYNPDILTRTMYLQTLITLKVRLAHYTAFLLPLFTTIVILLYDRAERLRDRRSIA